MTPFWSYFDPFQLPLLTPFGVTFPKSDFKSCHFEQKAVSGANFLKIAQWEHKNYQLLDLTPFWPHFDPFQLTFLTPLRITIPNSDFKSFHVEQKSVSSVNFIKIAQWEHKNYQLVQFLKSKNGSPLLHKKSFVQLLSKFVAWKKNLRNDYQKSWKF